MKFRTGETTAEKLTEPVKCISVVVMKNKTASKSGLDQWMKDRKEIKRIKWLMRMSYCPVQ